MGISWRSETKAHRGSHKAKTNAAYFSKRILTPVIEKDVPRLCKGDGEKRRLRPPIMLPKTHVIFSTKVNYGTLWSRNVLAARLTSFPWTVALMLSSKFSERQAGAWTFCGWNKCEPSTIQKVLAACLKWVKATSKVMAIKLNVFCNFL